MQIKMGLVLAGGGGKGSYQIGAWEALDELGLAQQVKVVSGTSIGALHAALFMQNSLDLAKKIWLDLTPGRAFSLDMEKKPTAAEIEQLAARLKEKVENLPARGIFSRQGLEAIMDSVLRDGEANPDRIGFATCLPWRPAGPPAYLPLAGASRQRMRQILLASSALPYIFDPVEIDGVSYVDGGMTGGDNVPIKPVYDQGCNVIFVIHLNQDGPIDPTEFPGAHLVQVIPSESLGGFVDGTLDFVGAHATHRMALGYRDLMTQLGVLPETTEAENSPVASADQPERTGRLEQLSQLGQERLGQLGQIGQERLDQLSTWGQGKLKHLRRLRREQQARVVQRLQEWVDGLPPLR